MRNNTAKKKTKQSKTCSNFELQKKTKQSKTCNNFELQIIEPKTNNQQKIFENYNEKNLVIHGPAGTGKTLISLYLALQDIENQLYNKILIVRSVVSTRPIGFLPGDEKQKAEVFEQPYRYIVNKLFHRDDAYSICKHKNMIEFTTTSFIRGLTYDDTIIIVDETANMTFHEINSLITRLGNNCKIIFCGDCKQSDLANLNQKNGFETLINYASRLTNHFTVVELTLDDIVRSDLVGDWCRLLYS